MHGAHNPELRNRIICLEKLHSSYFADSCWNACFSQERTCIFPTRGKFSSSDTTAIARLHGYNHDDHVARKIAASAHVLQWKRIKLETTLPAYLNNTHFPLDTTFVHGENLNKMLNITCGYSSYHPSLKIAGFVDILLEARIPETSSTVWEFSVISGWNRLKDKIETGRLPESNQAEDQHVYYSPKVLCWHIISSHPVTMYLFFRSVFTDFDINTRTWIHYQFCKFWTHKNSFLQSIDACFGLIASPVNTNSKTAHWHILCEGSRRPEVFCETWWVMMGWIARCCNRHLHSCILMHTFFWPSWSS